MFILQLSSEWPRPITNTHADPPLVELALGRL